MFNEINKINPTAEFDPALANPLALWITQGNGHCVKIWRRFSRCMPALKTVRRYFRRSIGMSRRFADEPTQDR
jgi:hypothetical protein